MVHDLLAVFESVTKDLSVRVIVLRGAGGHFCAGGDIKDMTDACSAGRAPGRYAGVYSETTASLGRTNQHS